MRPRCLLVLACVLAAASGCGGSGSSEFDEAMDALAPDIASMVSDEADLQTQMSGATTSPALRATIRRQMRTLRRLETRAEQLPASTAEQRRGSRLLARAFAGFADADSHYLLGVQGQGENEILRGEREQLHAYALLRQARDALGVGGGPQGSLENDLHELSDTTAPLLADATRRGDTLLGDLAKPDVSLATLRTDARAARDAYRRASVAYESFSAHDERLARIVSSYAQGLVLITQAYDDYVRGLSGGGQKLLLEGDTVKARGYEKLNRGAQQLKDLAATELNP